MPLLGCGTGICILIWIASLAIGAGGGTWFGATWFDKWNHKKCRKDHECCKEKESGV